MSSDYLHYQLWDTLQVGRPGEGVFMNYVSPGFLFVYNNDDGDPGGVEGGGGRGRYCHTSCCHHDMDVQRYVRLPMF